MQSKLIIAAMTDITIPSAKTRRDFEGLRLKHCLVTVRESPIHGKGLFATENLRTGDIVLCMDPLSFSAQERHPWNRWNSDAIPFFVNHSCNPNGTLIFSLVEHATTLTIVRPTKPDEEITIDYTLVEVGGRLIPCHCSSPQCRGYFPVHRERSW